MKYISLTLLSVLLMASLATAAAAATGPLQQQSDERPRAVLAEGEPPLTPAMVDDVAEFFEWLFEARFTAQQRLQLERILVATWQNNDRKEIVAVGNFSEFNDKLASAPEAKRNAARVALRPEILRDIRAESSEFSRLLLSVYEGGSANTGETAQSDNSEGSGAAASTAGDTPELLGSWRSSEIGLIGYQNSITGATKPGRGTAMQYRFLPGGRYEYNGYLETTMYNCTTTLFNPITGDYRLEGGQLILTPKTSKWQSRNNCAASMNKEQPGKLEPEAYMWRIKEEAGERQMCLTSAKGGEICYKREQ